LSCLKQKFHGQFLGGLGAATLPGYPARSKKGQLWYLVWKKGSRYGTILVDLEQRRVADLLPERSLESSTAWFKNHPEVDIVSRDRGKLFRQAASAGAPQAKHVVDRFHLQKNFAEALEKFFGHHKRLLK